MTKPFPEFGDQLGLLHELVFLEPHLLDGLALILLVALIRVKEECPGLLAAADGIRRVRMESIHVFQDWAESGGADELVFDLNDAGPQFVLQLLSVLWAPLHHDKAIIEIMNALRGLISVEMRSSVASHLFGGGTLRLSSMGVEMSQIHLVLIRMASREINDSLLRFSIYDSCIIQLKFQMHGLN